MKRATAINSVDGTMDALILTPEGDSGPLPAVVLFTDIGGLRPCYEEKAQKVADGGYAVLMPNIYYRDAPGSVVPEGQSFRDQDVRARLYEYAGRLTPDAQHRDFDALVATIDREPEFASGKIAVVGYCMTGAFALRMGAHRHDRVAAVAGFHAARLAVEGDANSPVGLAGQLKAQVYLGYADGDKVMPPEQIARMDAALAEAGVHFTTELYKGASHGYTAADTPAYDAVADARHYKRLYTLLEEALGA